jgi:hypothetical protein
MMFKISSSELHDLTHFYFFLAVYLGCRFLWEHVHVKNRKAVQPSVSLPVICINMTDDAKRKRTGLPTLRLEQWYYKHVGSNVIGGTTELF